ncbi:MAG: prenyltransferase/squalene oxidase repeat-containing protein, partial [Candidatus Thorarchaeota archaeon]
MRRTLIVLIIAFVLLATPLDSANPGEGSYGDRVRLQQEVAIPSASPGILIETGPYIVLELRGGDITTSGNAWSQMLNSSGIVSRVFDVSEILSYPNLLDKVSVMIIDASVGSGNGSTVSQTMIDLLIRKDISLILTGRSAWILHRLRDEGPPSLAVPASTVLLESAEYAGAVFMISPNSLTIGSSLTTETGIILPNDPVQTELSRLVDLTVSSPSSAATLRFDSMPLDVFLYSPEDPTKLTSTGQGLMENVVAFSSALRESETSTAIADYQGVAGSLIEGGFSYQHEPTIAATYYAALSARLILSGTEWTTWVSQNVGLVQSVLDTLIVDFGTESGFLTSVTEGLVNCMSTAQGLWLVSIMGLSAQFDVSSFVSYLNSQQSIDGGFENDITTTYHVTEAISVSGNLGSIDTTDLETWLRSLVIDGAKTANPDLWGAIGANPTSLSPTNDYARKYLRSLSFLGKAHPDPDKLTSWILSRTSIGDGSFRNSLNPDEEIVTGTAAALTSMQILGTLSSNNRTAGLSWFTTNQLDSGGFGMKPRVSDLVGKTRETSRVALCLNLLSETTGGIASGITAFLSTIKTDVGFEGMDILPSLMWTSWILSINRYSHSSGTTDIDLAEDYLDNYVKWTQYPIWENITALVAPEYLVSQYRTKSVWVQYFGALASTSLGIEFSPSVVSEATLYLSQAQYMTGHYRPTSLMGTAHVQHSVAAIETLYLLDELNTIPYRAALESAMLDEYSSGSWNSAGWNLEPFAGSREAIDFLTTRAAIRLGIVSSAMASEIAATVQARIQYTDLLALSFSVATLSLLNTSAFSVDLESIDRSQVISALRSSFFAAGWYNSSFLRQPIFTESVLKMVSILGLRPSLPDITGCTLTASASPTATLGSNIDISVVIESPSSTHSLLVNIFNKWILYEDVLNSDTLS